jgi:uncharacterized protein
MALHHSSTGRVIEDVTVMTTRPVARPVMVQGWYNLASVHWRYPPEIVQALVPQGFRIDTFDGSAWVGLIPFSMDRIGFPIGQRRLTAGRFSSFPETNVRTYIVNEAGQRGVWFFSLDITRTAATFIARTTYGLPYCWSTMTVDAPSSGLVAYQSQRRWPSDGSHQGRPSSRVVVRPGRALSEQSPTAERDAFLSARWALGSVFARRLMWAHVDHPPWELHAAELVECDESLVAACGLPAPVGKPVVLWSPGVDVRIGRPRIIGRA